MHFFSASNCLVCSLRSYLSRSHRSRQGSRISRRPRENSVNAGRKRSDHVDPAGTRDRRRIGFFMFGEQGFDLCPQGRISGACGVQERRALRKCQCLSTDEVGRISAILSDIARRPLARLLSTQPTSNKYTALSDATSRRTARNLCLARACPVSPGVLHWCSTAEQSQN